MSYRAKNNAIINGDFLSPEIQIASFAEGLIQAEQDRIVETLNAGGAMLTLYRDVRADFHILNVMDMLMKMEKVFSDYHANLSATKGQKDEC
jgi:hypothetical protein